MASRGLLAGIAAVTLVVFVIMLFTNGGDFSWMNYLTASVTPLSILLPIVGIMAATSEWSQHTAMTTFALEPLRLRAPGLPDPPEPPDSPPPPDDAPQVVQSPLPLGLFAG